MGREVWEEAGREAAGSSVGRSSAGMSGSVTDPGCLEPGPTLPDTRSELPASALPAHLVSGMCHKEQSERGKWKPKSPGSGLVSEMGSVRHYIGVMWKPTPQNRTEVSVIWTKKIGECKEYDDSLHSERSLRVFG